MRHGGWATQRQHSRHNAAPACRRAALARALGDTNGAAGGGGSGAGREWLMNDAGGPILKGARARGGHP
jgi:hypothetical protein